MSRLWASIVTFGFVAATLAPIFHDAPFADDSYPLSTYPMFARALSKRVIVMAVGVGRDGVVRLAPEFVANDEPMQAQRTLRMAASGGPDSLRQLCARIAQRVKTRERLTAVRRIRIVRATFDPIRYFEENAAAEKSETLIECRVPKRA